jgi:hypothetical protein
MRAAVALAGVVVAGSLVISAMRTSSDAALPVLREFTLTPGANGAEPDVAVDPTQAATVLVSGNGAVANGGWVVFRSADTGSSWTQGTANAGTPQPGDNNIEFDGLGNAFLTGIDGEGTGKPYSTLVDRSASHGASAFAFLSHAQSPSTFFSGFPDGETRQPCADPGFGYFDYPKLGADKGSAAHPNYLYVTAQTDFTVGGQCANYKTFIRSVDGGQTWDQGKVLPEATMGDSFENIAVSANGTVVLAGKAGGGTVPCVGGVGLWRSFDGGVSFKSSCILNGNSLGGRAWAAAQPGDRLRVWIAYEMLTANVHHISVAASTDGGDTFGPPVRVDDVLVPDAVDHLHPSLSVASNGRLDLAWEDFRNSNGDAVKGDVYYSYSLDGGRSWAANMRLTPAPAAKLDVGGNDYLNVASAPGTAFIAYGQDRDNNHSWEWYVSTATFG